MAFYVHASFLRKYFRMSENKEVNRTSKSEKQINRLTKKEYTQSVLFI